MHRLCRLLLVMNYESIFLIISGDIALCAVFVITVHEAFLFTVIFIKLCRLLQKNDLLLQVRTFCGWYMVIC